MKKVIVQKIIAMLLVLTLTVANMIVLAQGAYAAYTEAENNTNHKNVKLEAYFKQGEETSQTLTANKEENPLLYIKIGVNQYGYLKEANIEFENNNYKIEESESKEVIEKIEGNSIKLRRISNGEEIELAIPISFENQEKIQLDYFGRKSKVKLTGNYMDEEGTLQTIQGEVELQVKWKTDTNVQIKQEVEKYIGIEDVVILQTSLQWGVVENKLPIEKGKVSIQVPKIKEIKPETAKLISVNSTFETLEENWEYNKETGKIEIELKNIPSEDGSVNWEKALEEYKIIYTYKEIGQVEQTTINLNANASVKLYNKEETLDVNEEKQVQIDEKGEIVSAITKVTGEINKGYLYANNTYESAYQIKDDIQISEADFAKEIEVKHEASFGMEEGSLTGTKSTYYENTVFSKENVDEILGETGSIEIFDNAGNKIAQINKETKQDKNGNIVITYNKVEEVVIKIHNVEKEGQLQITSNKKIKGQTGYSIKNMQGMKTLKEVVYVTSLGKTTEASSQVELKETVTEAEVSSNVTSLSTVLKNENVEIRTILKSNSGKYDLYKAPVIEIQVPAQVETLEIKSAELLFTEELKIEKVELFEKSDGKKVIRVITSGEQTKYVPEINKGIQVVVNTNMTLNRKAVSSNEEFVVKYTNENGKNFVNEGIATATIEVSAPMGIIALNSIKNFSNENAEITSIGTQNQVGKLEILTEKKTATNTITIINNKGASIKNPYIIGRIPFEGNKKLTGEALGSNITTILKSKIRGVNIAEDAYTVYYSANGEASADASDWVTNPEKLENIKSYKIVLNSGKMEQAEEISFEYDLEIPEGLNYNKSAYSSYAIYYENTQTRAAVLLEKVEAPIAGISTGEGPELEANLTANVVEGAEVEEGQIIKYKVEVKNIGNVTANNVKVTCPMPKEVAYVKYETPTSFSKGGYQVQSTKEFTETKDSLVAGESYVAEYEVKVLAKAGSEIKMKANVIADKMEKELTTQEYKNTIIKGNFELELELSYNIPVDKHLAEGQEVKYRGAIKNVSSENQKNTIVVNKLPEGVEFKEAYMISGHDKITEGISYNENEHTVHFEIGDVMQHKQISIWVTVVVKALPEDKIEDTITNSFYVKSDNMDKEKYSNELVRKTGKAKLTVKQTSNKDKYISEDETIEYYVEIKNEGPVLASNVKVEDFLPEELTYTSIRSKINDEDESRFMSSSKECSYTLDIPANSTALITIVARAKNITDTKEVENRIEITLKDGEKIQANSLKHTIIKNTEVETPDGEKVNVYSISGTAWKDTNKNGKKEDEEEKLPNIEVLLIHADTGKIAQKVTDKSEQRIKTNEDGSYTFEEVVEGEYIVIFLYDTENYTVAEYKKAGLTEMENSDVRNANIILGGKNMIAAVTDKLSVSKMGISGINIGLVEVPKFELNMDKVVTKIFVLNPKETKTYTFEDAKLAKVDIDPKYINDTTVMIEYTLKITNSGEIAGYAKQIVDDMPKELNFQSELNQSWYVSKDGKAYNTSLENVLIQPGETKEIKLVLTKNMTEDGNGIVSNIANIEETYNEYAANNSAKDTEEERTADVVIGLKTGINMAYIIGTIGFIVVIAVIALGVYCIKKKIIS